MPTYNTCVSQDSDNCLSDLFTALAAMQSYNLPTAEIMAMGA